MRSGLPLGPFAAGTAAGLFFALGASALVEHFCVPEIAAAAAPVLLWMRVVAVAAAVPAVGVALMAVARRRASVRKDCRIARRRQDTQAAVSRVLAMLGDPADGTPRLLQAIGEGLGWDLGELWRVDGGLLRRACSWHVPGLDAEHFESASRDVTFGPGEGLPGRAWVSGRPIWMADVTEDPRFLRSDSAARAGLRGAFAFPVRLDAAVTGVLTFFSRRPQPPDRALLRFVAELGRQVGQYGERRRAEEALLLERSLLQTLMENVPDAIYFKDAQSRFLRINRAVSARFGLADPKIAVGRTDADYFREEFSHQTRADELQVMQTGRPILNKEEKEVWPDGRQTWASTTTIPLRDIAGRIVGILGISRDITERRRAEESLRHAEAKYRSIFENAVEGIYQTSVDGRFLTANPMLARLYGFDSPEELIAAVSNHANHLYVEPTRRVEFMQLMQERGAMTGFESQVRRRDGTVIWLSENARAILDSAGRVVGYEGTVMDVTERKRAEERLRAANDALRAVIQAAPLAIITLNPGGIIRSWNAAAERMFGWSEGEVLGWPTPLVPPEFQHEFQDLVARLERGEAFTGVQARRRRKDGSLLDVSLSAAPLHDAAGRVEAIMAVIADITEIKRAEQVLARERALLRCLIDSIPDHIFYKGRDGTYLGCNTAFERYVGRPERELLGRTARDLFTRPIGDAYGEADRQVLDAGKPRRSEDWIEYPDGRRTLIEVIKTPYFGPDGQILGLIGMGRDITDRKQLEDQLRQAQKMEAVGQLAGGIAHDFNNLLTAILGNVSLLLSRSEEGVPGHDLLQQTERAAVRAAELTRQLLGFSRRTLLQLEPTDLNASIGEVVGMLRRTIDPRITVELRGGAALWPVEADGSQMNQVLVNLCLNARDAMPDGGTLALETTNVVVEAAYAQQHLEARAGDFVRLRVRDSGCGMPPEIQSRIFDPFFTTKGPGKGTGLGLAMVFGIVKQHQGWIECHSTVGEGTSFDVYLPRCVGGDVRPAAPAGPRTPGGGTETLLLVDDEAIIRNLGRTILEQFGYRVLLAEDGEEAVDVYRREYHAIDLVILDLTMPRLSGRDTLRRMHEVNPGVQVLFSSGYSADHVIESGREGVLGFVPKPYRPHDLAATVRVALDGAKSRKL
ncbi:MAG: PAS domain S-box protein [Gemmataceae bacterium]|nr:PAS domain S-box protein [Gemmataceae bacterium]